MFLQVIQGKTNDAEGLRGRVDSWQRDLRPGATGYVGTTGGVAEDGTAIFLVRFQSEEAARANSDRPEQGEWWEETAQYFDGEVTFRNCSEVDESLNEGAENAGFVQVMQGRVRDKARLKALEEEFMPRMAEMRQDVLGSIRGWDGDAFTDAIHFTSEADARKGEASMAENVGEEFGEFMALVEDLTYIDLKDPWIRGA